MIEVVLADITCERTDAVVTAANESLMGGGGVDGAIHRAAGPRLAEAGAAIGPCAPGDAMATPAFDLDPPVRHVIHTVGPVWEDGSHGEVDVLASCYRRCLQVADELGVRSIAIPAIATGVYGFPAEDAARIAVSTIASISTAVQQVRLIAFDETTHNLLAAELARRSTSDPGDSVLLAQLDTTDAEQADAWSRLAAVADEFAALPHADGDVRWSPAEELPDGVITVAYPIYGERVERACRALVNVGAVTPVYPWMQKLPPAVPSDGALPPADAVRLATATVRGERFGDGIIGQAVEQGTLQAILISLSTWYGNRSHR